VPAGRASLWQFSPSVILGEYESGRCGCQIELKPAESGWEVADKLKSLGNPADLSCRQKRESRKILSRGLGCHQELLISDPRRGRFVCNKRQLQMADDPVHHGIVGEERDDLHLSAALRADQGVDFVHFTDHLSPAPGRDRPQVLHRPERKRLTTRLLDLPSMGVGVQAEVADGDLSFVGNMGGDSGDELQVVHPLDFSGLFPIPVADLGFPFIEGEAFKGEQRPDHVFAHPIGLSLCLGPDPAMNIEPRVPPGEEAFRPFGAEKFLADKIGQDFSGEEIRKNSGPEARIKAGTCQPELPSDGGKWKRQAMRQVSSWTITAACLRSGR